MRLVSLFAALLAVFFGVLPADARFGEASPCHAHEQAAGEAQSGGVAHSSGDELATVLYAGDAANDAHALAVAAELGGIALGVGPEPPAVANYRLPDPAALAELLVALAKALTAAGSSARTDPPP